MNAGTPRSDTVIGILGPTGVGKTAVAVEVARSLGVDVISCDSMQVYRDFPILTNQPSPDGGRDEPDRSVVRHRLVGFLDPTGVFSAAEYAEAARPLIEQDLAEHGAALVVGGTGLYMRAALAPLAVAPAGDPALRRRLEERAAASGAAALHQELARLDPAAAAAVDARNVRRVVRALEVVMTTGEPWSGREDLWRPRYYHRTLLVGLICEREGLHSRIELRTRGLVTGAVDEVRRFRERGGAGGAEAAPAAAPAAAGAPVGGDTPRVGIRAAIGFAEISRYLDGLQGFEETVEQVAAATRRYARRQLTWLQKVDGLVIINGCGREPGDVARTILDLAEQGDHIKEPEHR